MSIEKCKDGKANKICLCILDKLKEKFIGLSALYHDKFYRFNNSQAENNRIQASENAFHTFNPFLYIISFLQFSS